MIKKTKDINDFKDILGPGFQLWFSMQNSRNYECEWCGNKFVQQKELDFLNSTTDKNQKHTMCPSCGKYTQKMICPRCGKSYEGNKVKEFCPECGTKYSATSLKCPKCKTENDIKYKYCTACGSKLK